MRWWLRLALMQIVVHSQNKGDLLLTAHEPIPKLVIVDQLPVTDSPSPDYHSMTLSKLELTRHRALHHVHDAARILGDSLYLAHNLKARSALTEIIGALQTLERQLTDLEVTQ